jgi:hypothetical protein
MNVQGYSDRVERGYRMANLTELLAQIRAAGRYVEASGVLSLTTEKLGMFDSAEANRQLAEAEMAGRFGNSSFQPKFSHPARGLSHGLNPYSDWTMSVLSEKPRHTYLFLGLDFYDVADLARVGDWETYLQNPFEYPDPFWHKVWAWIMGRTMIGSSGKTIWEPTIRAIDAASFIKSDGGAFVFHNLLPYLRPAGTGSTDKGWPTREWKKLSVRKSVIEDLYLLRTKAEGRTIAYCTNAAAVDALRKAGFSNIDIVCWSAHPSNYFHPSLLYPRGLHFKKNQ